MVSKVSQDGHPVLQFYRSSHMYTYVPVTMFKIIAK